MVKITIESPMDPTRRAGSTWRQLCLVAASTLTVGASALSGTAHATPALDQVSGASIAAASDLPKVVAFGDSFTAGFGYYNDGSEMSSLRLLSCKPEAKLVDACSSNSSNRNNTDSDLRFAPDYGFANQVSWAAQFASKVGIRTSNAGSHYRNFAVTGSTPQDWANDKLTMPSGRSGLHQIIHEDPDIVVGSIGGNPSLSEILLGAEGEKCAKLTPLSKGQGDCFLSIIRSNGWPESLRTIYRTLLERTDATILQPLYPQIVPALDKARFYSAEEVLYAGQLLNHQILLAMKDAQADLPPSQRTRLRWANKDFKVGIPPGNYSSWWHCYGKSAYGVGTDGQSEQSEATGAIFIATRGITGIGSGYCGGGPDYVISTDTGIHPSKAGYGAISNAVTVAWNERSVIATPNTTSSDNSQELFSRKRHLAAAPQSDVTIPLTYIGGRDTVRVKITRQPHCSRPPSKPKQIKKLCTEQESLGTFARATLDQTHETLKFKSPARAGHYLVTLGVKDRGPEDAISRFLSLRVR